MDPEPTLGTLGVSWEYTLDGVPVHHRAVCRHVHKQGQFSIVNPPTGMFLGGWRKTENLEETHTATGSEVD